MRLIDADALERDGWQMSRTVRVDKDTMEIQTRKPTDFPTIEPQRMRGKWIPIQRGFFNKEVTQVKCDQCGNLLDLIGVNCGRGDANFCPNCGCQMCGGEEDE